MNTTPDADDAAVTTHVEAANASNGTVRRPRPLLAVVGLILEAAAVSALLIDGRQLTWIAWLPGWAGFGLALSQVRAGGWPRLVAAVTAVLFAVGTVLGITAATR